MTPGDFFGAEYLGDADGPWDDPPFGAMHSSFLIFF